MGVDGEIVPGRGRDWKSRPKGDDLVPPLRSSSTVPASTRSGRHATFDRILQCQLARISESGAQISASPPSPIDPLGRVMSWKKN